MDAKALSALAGACVLVSGFPAVQAQSSGDAASGQTSSPTVVGPGEVTSGPNRSIADDTTTTGPGSYTGGAGAAPETMDQDEMRRGSPEASNDGGNWGLLGLLGLFGLMGLKRNNAQRDVDEPGVRRTPASR